LALIAERGIWLNRALVSPLDIVGSIGGVLGLWRRFPARQLSLAEPKLEKPRKPVRRPDPRQLELPFNR